MKPILYIVFLILIAPKFFSQQFGNEWIDYGQSYYSFNIYQSGIHKIDFSVLQSAGIPIQSFSSDNIQMFGRQNEIPIFIEDGGDGSIDNGDYILFYAEKNDGWLDTSLYDNPEWMGNPKYSLYNDTIEYFFTWNNLTNNKRFNIETDTDYNSYTPSEYVLFEVFESFNDLYNESVSCSSSDVSSSFYVEGEGWGTAIKNGVNNSNGHWDFPSLSFENVFQNFNSPDIQYKSVLIAKSAGAHHTKHTIGNNHILFDSVFTCYTSVFIENSFSPSLVSPSGSSNFKIDIIDDQGAATDVQSLNYWSFVYPRTPSFSNSNYVDFEVINSTTKVRLDMSNLNMTNPIMFSLGSVPAKIPVTMGANTFQVLIPNDPSSTKQPVVIQDFSSVFSVSQLTAVNGTGVFTDFSSNFINDSSVLIVYPPELTSASIEYATYRSSVDGGNHNVILANVNELYQQYGGGIKKHINGIRNFAFDMYASSSNNPSALFLIGKGIRESNIQSNLSSGLGSRKNPLNFQNSLMPSFGQPSCDVCITSNSSFSGFDKFTPIIPTGRIAAKNNQELIDYLNKVKKYELEQNQNMPYDFVSKDWQKQIMHFSGGNNFVEQQAFQLNLNTLAGIIEQDDFGANVTLVAKETGNPISPLELQNVKDRISNGVSMMTFFGHASSTSSGFDINLDEPTYWDNEGKYPLLLANSCYNGNLFQSTVSKSEEFVLTPNAGVIAYIGSISLGYPTPLFEFSKELYEQLSKLNYGGTFSEHVRNCIDIYLSSSSNEFDQTTFLQMNLHGDPLLKSNYHNRPEIELLESNISIEPQVVTLTTDSIDVSVKLINLGKSIVDTFDLQITRNFPGSSTDSIYHFLIPKLNYDTSVLLKLPLQPTIGIGLNQFDVAADIPSIIGEQYDEISNNIKSKNFFIDIDGIQPIIPHNFAVVGNDTISLFASTINPLANFTTYRFEIDTTYLFNSPYHRYYQLSGYGGVKSVSSNDWISVPSNTSSPIILEDSTVYYWRVAIDEPNPLWKRSSFQYISNKTGWGQDDFFQFTDNSSYGVLLDTLSNQRIFEPFVKTISCLTNSAPCDDVSQIFENAWYLSDEQQEYGICNCPNKFHVAIIDKTTLLPWETRHVPTNQNMNNNFGNANDNENCQTRPMKFFTFNQNNVQQMIDFRNLIENVVPNGDYILIYTPMSNRYDYWDANQPQLYSTFANLGSTTIAPGLPNKPFIFLTRKGDPSFVVEHFQQNNEAIYLDTILTGQQYAGNETSPIIGPSANWESIYWKQNSVDLITGDTTDLKIMLYDYSGNYQYSIDTSFTSFDSILMLNNLIDANQFPYIKLSSDYVDAINQTPAQIDFWHVLYEPFPEAAIDGTNGYTWLPGSDTLQEGQVAQFAIDVSNISQLPMDSLLINYFVIDKNQNKHIIPYSRRDSLRVNETLRDTVDINTLGLEGINYLWMEVNPYIDQTNTITDQPELSHLNNILQMPFYVSREDENPILDVTFNGRHILNEDIIAPTTELVISLKDENEYLIMNEDADTALFAIYLTDPDGIQKRIPFVNQMGVTIMQWIPANSQNKKFKIIYPAYFEKSGMYSILIEGSDKSGNASGDYAYQIEFEVIHESMVSQIINYPNPFSTSTRFVFTLTGDLIPDDLQIQIMNINGRVVREIDENEIGPIFIGRNISDFAWDGKDQFGDQLANGVYLYRVKMKINGQDVNTLPTNTDNYIHKGFGKMYLIR